MKTNNVFMTFAASYAVLFFNFFFFSNTDFCVAEGDFEVLFLKGQSMFSMYVLMASIIER